MLVLQSANSYSCYERSICNLNMLSQYPVAEQGNAALVRLWNY